nr:hypothetical protein [candidate division Zixibacteria bacterium]NIR67816.1 hypothetical protein [candidate division Zixibacteria bacterium]NIS15516.1 hypothetical protein [candidate division Zixibacteria bacterium]NIS49041.1 hypothetical protein [candidate division Zixibacteria bacterium]NIT52035.1 hypothetical protein [candidate division Zixibacteria bacterium]
KAAAWNSYSQPALLQMMFEKLPDLAKEMAAPISKVDKIVMVSNDGKMGTSKITGEMASMMSQLPVVVKSMTGFDLEDWVKRMAGKNEEAKTSESTGKEGGKKKE